MGHVGEEDIDDEVAEAARVDEFARRAQVIGGHPREVLAHCLASTLSEQAADPVIQ
ncbi:DNA-binding ferritin-like protein [Streptosporangium becharense]|uniref:DNA-binding ferritin-like protein n=1 Tax=Streptosporangium becharense TaxID=1816182 RepID=A0A7W9IMX8_9ACTN|nr:hypothetical protein [Streptosporangium becharense]MBB2914266.1 DNA-binding ferritin-like protein [Streptosporangium becharense]MBB5823702.1 DNA-binding ferritin-like protein [Streptosporangium becharense]